MDAPISISMGPVLLKLLSANTIFFGICKSSGLKVNSGNSLVILSVTKPETFDKENEITVDFKCTSVILNIFSNTVSETLNRVSNICYWNF